MTHQGATSSASLGRLSRLARLTSGGAVHLLAMDHAVTEGWYEGQDSPDRIAQECVDLGITGIVCHRGLLRLLPTAQRAGIFLQLYGSVGLGGVKSQLLEPEQALTLDCIGVSVELDVDEGGGLASAFQVVERAQRLGLLTLLMLKYSGDTASNMARALAVGTQVGPDFIKLRLANDAVSTAGDAALEGAVERAPAVLMAGGSADEGLGKRLEAAKRLGFRGTCIGRNYFFGNRHSNAERAVSTFASDA